MSSRPGIIALRNLTCSKDLVVDGYIFELRDEGWKYVMSLSYIQQNPNEIQIILSGDDLELVNHLGVHIKEYKAGIGQYTSTSSVPIGSVRSGYPVKGAAALGFRARILRSSSGMK